MSSKEKEKKWKEKKNTKITIGKKRKKTKKEKKTKMQIKTKKRKIMKHETHTPWEFKKKMII